MISLKKAYKLSSALVKELHPPEIILTEEERKIKKQCEKSLLFFTQYFWNDVVPDPFKSNWHIDARAEHLEALVSKTILQILLSEPPRQGKSIMLGVMFTPWVWIADYPGASPTARFMFNSYNEDLLRRDALLCRTLIDSPKFKKFWGHKVFLKKGHRKVLDFRNNHGGSRLSISMSGGVTGSGSDYLIIDDPNNILNALSPASLFKVNWWWDVVMPTRVHNPAEQRIVISQQRCNVEDLTGHVLSSPSAHRWVHFRVPMEFEKNHRCVTVPLPSTNGKKWQDPRTRENELLFPAHFPRTEVDKLKERLKFDPYVIAGQLQQRPTPLGGGALKISWFKLWEEADYPEFEHILTSWDTAFTKGDFSAYSAASTWGLFEHNGVKNLMFLSLFKDKLEYPDLRQMVLRLAINYEDTVFKAPAKGINKVDRVVIESKASGYSLMQDLSRQDWPSGIIMQGFDPTKDAIVDGRRGFNKEGRAMLVSHLIAAGQVWIPSELPKCEVPTEEAQMLLNACQTFPSPDANDVIDTLSQALIVFSKEGSIYNRKDPQPPSMDPYRLHNKRPLW